MKAAGAAGVIGSGFVVTTSATEPDSCAEAELTGDETCDDCTLDCSDCAVRGSCTEALTADCEEIPGTRINLDEEEQCHEVSAGDIPDEATHAVIKAANDCWVCDVIDPTKDQTFCIQGDHDISHIEFAECPNADITIQCEDDRARIDVDVTDRVYFEVSYTDCDPESELDEPTAGTLTFSDDAAGGTEDDWHAFVPLADCEGTITVWNSSSKEVQFDSADFDCESGTVTADCESDKITVFAEDTTDLWYEIDFVNCDESDVGRTMVSGLDSADTVTILEPIPNCEGTVTLYEDENSTEALDSDTFDCVTATVSVACNLNETGEASATIDAADTETVWYEIDYDNCDVGDVGRTEVDLSSTDSVTFDIAECDGTITVWDAASDGDMLASATIDCADATVSVACNVNETGEAKATIFSPDTDPVWYEIDYDRCDESDVSRTELDIPDTADEVTFGIAECDGIISVFDGAGSDATEIASTVFDCADADVTVDCALDTLGDATATITAPDLDTVWYTTTYTNCDDGTGVDREKLDLSTNDSATVDIAECDGSIEVYDAASGGDLIASADIDCADANVSVACSLDTLDDASATIDAPDADTVWYEIDYDNCDVGEVTRTELDLSSTDQATFDIAECDGTIDVYDAASDGDLIASATIDCADADVRVDCALDTLGDATASIEAPDADTVWYEIDYDNCDVADVGRTALDLSTTDSATFDIAECDGTIDVYDAANDGDLLATAEIDCADADVSVECSVDALGDATATIEAPDTEMVWYAVDYDNCDVADVPRTKLDLSGVDIDTGDVDLAECSGTIDVWDAAEGGTKIASADFNCGDADVSVACTTDAFDDATATITAPDLDTVWYTTSYVNCDVSGVTLEPVSLSGTTDSATFDIAECDGTIEVYDAASGGNLIASADIDCADAQVTVDCVDEQAVITAPDTDVVEYEIVYAGTCTTDDVLKTKVTMGEDDEATVSVADCAGTINVFDLEGDLLATADFDCVPTVTGLSADCDKVTADFTDFIAGDQVRIDVEVKDSTGGTITTLDSGTVTLESGGGGTNATVNDTDGDGIFEQVVYTYSNELSAGTSYQTVDVSVFLVDQNRFLELSGGTDEDGDGINETRTFDVGPCGCPDCPEDLEVKFEEPGISVCDEKDGFIITEVDRDSEGELERLCFATTDERPTFCELGVCVKAGPETQKEVVSPETDPEDEPCGLGNVPEYCVSTFNKHAISHITIICPDDECPEEGRGNGGGPPGGI